MQAITKEFGVAADANPFITVAVPFAENNSRARSPCIGAKFRDD
jgi:hypothetical protein